MLNHLDLQGPTRVEGQGGSRAKQWQKSNSVAGPTTLWPTPQGDLGHTRLIRVFRVGSKMARPLPLGSLHAGPPGKRVCLDKAAICSQAKSWVSWELEAACWELGDKPIYEQEPGQLICMSTTFPCCHSTFYYAHWKHCIVTLIQ